MKFYINKELYKFDIWTYLKSIFPKEEIQWSNDLTTLDFKININKDKIKVAGYRSDKKFVVFSDNNYKKIMENSKVDEIEKIQKRTTKKLIYEVVTELYNKKIPWGILTGIRPSKMVLNLLYKNNYNYNVVRDILINEYKINPQKINLVFEIIKKEKFILENTSDKDIHLYIGIPFCPTKCLYCSFTSYSIPSNRSIIISYIDALIREINIVIKKLTTNCNIRTIYIGGGTPTALTASELDYLLKSLSLIINLNKIEEFTVEAGRPDTITKEKLEILNNYNVNRISINPQTMNQKTLDIIGRSHTINQIFESYELARKLYFDINMDIILGLPGETISDVKKTIDILEKMRPDNITVHTLAIKRASRLKEKASQYNLITNEIVEKMLEMSYERIREMGLFPYYMYRQKNMLGNFENVGYAIHGKECIYNVEIIQEQQSILAFGSGAITKIILPNNEGLKRIENVKNINEYINRIDEMIERKMKINLTN